MKSPIDIDAANIKNGTVTKKLCCSKYEVSVSGGVVVAASDVSLQIGDMVNVAVVNGSFSVLQKTGSTTGNVTIRR
ncbi:MAG: hypothetical protein HQK97_09205 [Nitrospirae bacterium]|nr:hypothetical protein [Nitrospirota bacterium]